MPTYDYECKSCGNRWELFQKITDEAVKKCPECGKKSAQRQFGTGAAIVFKGSGFYQTDYRSDAYKKAAKAESKSTDSGSSSSGKGESSKEAKGTDAAGTTKSSKSAKSSKPGGTE